VVVAMVVVGGGIVAGLPGPTIWLRLITSWQAILRVVALPGRHCLGVLRDVALPVPTNAVLTIRSTRIQRMCRLTCAHKCMHGKNLTRMHVLPGAGALGMLEKGAASVRTNACAETMLTRPHVHAPAAMSRCFGHARDGGQRNKGGRDNTAGDAGGLAKGAGRRMGVM